MTTDRDRVLSEFIDSWNAGRRPDIDEHLELVPQEERDGLLEDITSFISWAPTPDYDDDALAAIRAEPAVASAFDSYEQGVSPFPSLLERWRARAALSTSDVASRLVEKLGLAREREAKTQAYVEQLEAGKLSPDGLTSRLLEALSDVLAVPRRRFDALGGLGGATVRAVGAPPPAAAPAMFRAMTDAAETVSEDLDLMAAGMAAKSERDWDEVDELFRGGR